MTQIPIGNSSDEFSWWHRPCGGKEVLRLALPLVLSSLSWTLLTFIDRMFLLWSSEDALAAAFPAALVWWTCICFPLGICMYVNTFVSQYHGAGRPKRIGPCVWQGVWLAVAATPLAMAVGPFSRAIFTTAGHGTQVIEQEILYFQTLCWGTAAMLISYAMSAFYTGRGKTWVMMVIDGFSALVNIVLDYLWIFGACGFPELGIVGAGWATVIALWAKVAIYLVLVFRRDNRLKFRTAELRWNRSLLQRLIYYGGPSGLQMFLEVGGFAAFVLLVGRLGTLQLTATNLAFNVSSLAFMPVFGLATAGSIVVGQRLGENRPELAARGTWTTCWLSLGYMSVISALYVLVPDLFLYGFLSQSQFADKAALRQMAVTLLCFVAAYNLFDALNLVFVSAIKGAGDTRFVFVVSLAMAIVLAVGTWLAISVFRLSVYGCWALVTVWIWVLGLVYLLRFLQGRWREMRVIEPHVAAADSPAASEAPAVVSA